MSLFQEGYFEKSGSYLFDEVINKQKRWGDNVTFVQARLTELVDDHNVVVEKTGNGGSGTENLHFDFLAICTGGGYTANESKDEYNGMTTLEERKAAFQKYREEVEAAKCILIVGGGATGVEMLGELQIKYGDAKKWGLMTSQSTLLQDFPEDCQKQVHNWFESQDTELITGKRFEKGSDIDSRYDFVMMCVGYHFNSGYMDKNFSDFKNQKGEIFVNTKFQLSNRDYCKFISSCLLYEFLQNGFNYSGIFL